VAAGGYNVEQRGVERHRDKKLRFLPPRGRLWPLRARQRAQAAERRRFATAGLACAGAQGAGAPPQETAAGAQAVEHKCALGVRGPVALPAAVNQRWSLDFVSGTLIDGQWFRMLSVVDDFSRECLALVADTWLPGRRVVRELDVVDQPYASGAGSVAARL